MRMKSTIILLIFLLTGFFSFSQNYESIFGSQSTQWNMTIGNLWGTGSTKHTVLGDTLLNEKEYKIIDGYFDFESREYLGFLREDTISGKVWYCNSKDTSEILIMDMNLNVGDSMYIGGNWNSFPGNYKVDSIYYLNNKKHIRFDFKIPFLEQEPFVLIEGITSNLGFRFQDWKYINNFDPILLCSYKNGTKIYGSEPCEIPIQGIKESQNKSKIEIFPNPFIDVIKVQVHGNNKQKKYKILNLDGKQILNGAFTFAKTLDLSKLTSGIYLIIVTNDNNLIIGKKIIIKK